MLTDTGIYRILNNITGDYYIGSATSFYKRKSSHWTYLKTDTHFNRHLQRAVNRDGLDNFTFEVLEGCTRETLVQREQYFIDTLKPAYNIRLVANSNVGLEFTVEHRLNLSKALKGKQRTQEQKDHQRRVKIGKTHTASTKAKVSKIVNELKGNRVGDKIDREGILKLIDVLNTNTTTKPLKTLCRENSINYRSALRFMHNQTWKELFSLLNNTHGLLRIQRN